MKEINEPKKFTLQCEQDPQNPKRLICEIENKQHRSQKDLFGLDPINGTETSTQKSQGEHEIPNADRTGSQETEISDSVIQQLENQRAILDRAITELRGTFPRIRGSGTTSRKEVDL